MEGNLFKVYKSSAGSGKTYTLVKEYLKLVLYNPSKVRNILAITFTNAASAEMKERIIEALANITTLRENLSTPGVDNENTKSLVEQLAAETSLDEKTIFENSGKVLSYILHNYNDLGISTIDSFTHRILRTFAFDLYIPVNFEIEFDTHQVIEQAADILVSFAGQRHTKELTDLLVSFIESRTDEERSFAIEREIVSMAQNLLNEDSINYIDKLKQLDIAHFIEAHKVLSKRIGDFKSSIVKLASEGLDLIGKGGIPVTSLAQGQKGIYSWFKKLSQGQINDGLPPNKTVIKIVEGGKWHSSKASKEDAEAIDVISPRLNDIVQQIIKLSDENLGDYIISENTRQNIFSLALINEMEKTIDTIRQEENILFISDFNKKISAVIAREPVPFIYERIGERYHNFMIDEFQDTSVLQWQNMLPLIENGLAGGNMSLIVGDAKQSIYRWRGGDAYQFIMLPQLTGKIFSINKQQVEKTLAAHYCQIPRDPDAGTVNYRSCENIVNFNNDFFETIKPVLPGLVNEVYSGHHQKSLKSKTGGYVELSFIEELKGDRAALNDSMANKVESIINDLTARNYAYSDIAILCRKKKEAAFVAQHLTQQGVRVISDESLLLSFSPKVNFLISFLKLIDNTEDSIALTECARFLFDAGLIRQPSSFHLCLKEVFDHHEDNEGADETSFERFSALLKSNGFDLPRSLFSATSVYEVFEEITRLFLPPGQPVDPYITFFLDCVHDYRQKNHDSISGFLNYWDKNSQKFSLAVPDKLNAVKVITIHKSKGLQFPVVIYPFANETVRWHADDGFWIDLEDSDIPWIKAAYLGARKNLLDTGYAGLYQQEDEYRMLDMVNLIYVAFTRPQEKLFVISSRPASGKFPNNSLGGILYGYLHEKGFWNNEQLVYRFPGDPGKGEYDHNTLGKGGDGESKKEEDNGNWMEYYINRPWKDIVTVRLHGEPGELGDATKTTRGRAIHKAMENITGDKDLPVVMEQLVMDGFITKAEKEVLEKNVADLINDASIKQFFSDQYSVKIEPGIFDEDGNFYRPDRVAFSEKQTAIIDYKTGKKHEKHRHQICKYGSLLKDMGCQNIKLFIIYLDLIVIEEVGMG